MAQKKIWFDFLNNAIMVEVNYLRQTQKVGSKAYVMLLAAKRDNPNARIVPFGERKDNYNHITIKCMQNYFEQNGIDAGMQELNRMVSSKETLVNKNGRVVKKYNMGKIRQWFMQTYSCGYIEYAKATTTAHDESSAAQVTTAAEMQDENKAA